MSFMDHIPHKWALNKTLRKEADKLKARLDSYQIEYERKMRECQAEIDKAQIEKEAELDRVRESLEQELQQDQEMYEALLKDMAEYADTFLQRNFQFIFKENLTIQSKIIDEEIKFLKSQMDETRTEIAYLRERKSALSAFSGVQDIIELSNDCGYDIQFSSDDDADSLLKKVNKAIENCSDDRIMRVSLLRLKGIIYERSEYLSTIKYIEWVIQQKINYSKQLSEKRQNLIAKFKAVKENIKKICDEIKALNHNLDEKAKQIRFYWMNPITRLNAEIDSAFKRSDEYNQKLTSKKRRHKSICSELKEMKEISSHDQVRWDRLQRECRELSDDIDNLKAEIEEIKSKVEARESERKGWNDKRDHICFILNQNKVSFITNKRIAASDEQRIIASRLAEIEQIRIKGAAEAEEVCQQEKDKLISEYNAQRDANLKRIDELSEELKETEARITITDVQQSDIRTRIKSIKEKDNRFFITKWLSELPELSAAKKEEADQSAVLSRLMEAQNVLNKQIEGLKSKNAELEEKHEKDLKLCRPKPLRPTSAEKREEEMLKLRQKNIREKRNGNKN